MAGSVKVNSPHSVNGQVKSSGCDDDCRPYFGPIAARNGLGVKFVRARLGNNWAQSGRPIE